MHDACSRPQLSLRKGYWPFQPPFSLCLESPSLGLSQVISSSAPDPSVFYICIFTTSKYPNVKQLSSAIN